MLTVSSELSFLMLMWRRLPSSGFGLSGNADSFTVSVPTSSLGYHYRSDLFEEIARIYGYDRLPTSLQRRWDSWWIDCDTKKLRRQVRTIAEGAGLTEIITYALTTPEKAVEFTAQPSNLTELMWPMTVDRSVLRQNMISGILDTVAYNVARKNKNLALYEIGKVFEQTGNPKEELPNEINSFAFALTGLVLKKKISKQQQFQLISSMLRNPWSPIYSLGTRSDYTATSEIASLHPGRTAVISLIDQVLGFLAASASSHS